ncbi:hypothetical protein HDIA_1748 [Hartmannibacter diazotrophicus]|uniref:Molybdopterin-guanine dinucleotide biosynthesis protein A n=1 Tax=Hartmannibacter diazotrophicus TaxID=1482074 RepID=A0A2C9D539_9HYPH|nr:DUF3305 domain-containing protein [Hartmannibacter diazotrophicus]SON55289.1 hypothetical protein HDIA_1748 [Hartmannibacter diazotrophicus]
MDRELTILVGVLVERRKSSSRWISHTWIPVGVMPVADGLQPGDVLVEDDSVTRYFMGVSELTCFAAETEAYVHNFNAEVPALYVVLRRNEDGSHPLPWYVHAVTASPYLAQDHDDNADDIVERVAMPAEIEEAIKAFVDHHHVEHAFKKRRREGIKEEEHLFGKEPIFLNRERPSGGRLDG